MTPESYKLLFSEEKTKQEKELRDYINTFKRINLKKKKNDNRLRY